MMDQILGFAKLAMWLTSVMFGAMGIFCLWESFFLPWPAGYAIILLLTATGILLGAPKK